MILTLYLLLMVVQGGQGATAELYGSLEDCQTERELNIKHPEILAISQCTKIELVQPEIGYDKGVKTG